MTDVMKKSEFEKKQGLQICNQYFATATDLADYLVIKKNIPLEIHKK